MEENLVYFEPDKMIFDDVIYVHVIGLNISLSDFGRYNYKFLQKIANSLSMRVVSFSFNSWSESGMGVENFGTTHYNILFDSIKLIINKFPGKKIIFSGHSFGCGLINSILNDIKSLNNSVDKVIFMAPVLNSFLDKPWFINKSKIFDDPQKFLDSFEKFKYVNKKLLGNYDILIISGDKDIPSYLAEKDLYLSKNINAVFRSVPFADHGFSHVEKWHDINYQWDIVINYIKEFLQ